MKLFAHLFCSLLLAALEIYACESSSNSLEKFDIVFPCEDCQRDPLTKEKQKILSLFNKYPRPIDDDNGVLEDGTSFSWITKLGKGSFGQVWAIEFKNKSFPEGSKCFQMAIKIQKVTSEEAHEDVMQEILCLKLMNADPYSVYYYGCFRDSNYYYCTVMEKLEGNWESAHILDPPVKISLMITAAKALKTLHSLSWVHLDISPLNLIHDGHGNTRLGDYGMARTVKQDKKPWCATLAPSEMLDLSDFILVEEYDAGCIDIFCLGLAMIELCMVFQDKQEIINDAILDSNSFRIEVEEEKLKDKYVDGDKFISYLKKNESKYFRQIWDEKIRALFYSMINSKYWMRPTAAKLVLELEIIFNKPSNQKCEGQIKI